jgi:ribosomal 30S subunit maturation factor RimM
MTMRKMKTLALCSVALMMAGATTVLADPAAGDPYTQNPTPQERAQTQQLNDNAANDAATRTSAAQQQNDVNQAQYQAQQDQYEDARARYAAQRARYLDERAEYNFDRSHPYAWWHERYESATLNHFYDIPRAELIGLRIVRENGYMVGRISDVMRRDDGKVLRVRVELRDGERAWIDARDVRFDPIDRIVFTDLSAGAIYDLAANS